MDLADADLTCADLAGADLAGADLQALALDEMTLRLKRQLGRAKLDKAEMLAALVGLAEENSAVFGALVARMQPELTS